MATVLTGVAPFMRLLVPQGTLISLEMARSSLETPIARKFRTKFVGKDALLALVRKNAMKTRSEIPFQLLCALKIPFDNTYSS